MINAFRKLLRPTLRQQLEDGVREALRRYADRRTAPDLRVYASVDTMPRVADGLGTTILSTPQGVMADHEAKAQNLGGEVLCRVF